MEERDRMKTNYQTNQKDIDWTIIEQGLSEAEMIIALSNANGNYTVISFCPNTKKFERRIVFQWTPIIVDYCRGCGQFHYKEDDKQDA